MLLCYTLCYDIVLSYASEVAGAADFGGAQGALVLRESGKPVAHNYGAGSMNYGLLFGFLANFVGLLGFPGSTQSFKVPRALKCPNEWLLSERIAVIVTKTTAFIPK